MIFGRYEERRNDIPHHVPREERPGNDREPRPAGERAQTEVSH